MTFLNDTATNGGAIFAFVSAVSKINDSAFKFIDNKAINGEYHDGCG